MASERAELHVWFELDRCLEDDHLRGGTASDQSINPMIGHGSAADLDRRRQPSVPTG